jgi:hypothetical protein
MVNGDGSQDISTVMSDVVSRLRTLENRYELFGERLLIVNRNMIEEYKKITTENRNLKAEIKQLNQDIFNTKEMVRQMFKELKFFAKKDEIKALDKYIKMWEPMDFCTEEDVKLIVKGMR